MQAWCSPPNQPLTTFLKFTLNFDFGLKNQLASAKCSCAQPPIYLLTLLPRYYERRYRQLGHKMVARRLCQKWPHSRGHYYAHLSAFLHPRSQLLKVDSPKIEVNMNEHQDTPICGDKSNFVGSKVTPLAGSPLWWFLLTFASEASTPRLLPFWKQV